MIESIHPPRTRARNACAPVFGIVLALALAGIASAAPHLTVVVGSVEVGRGEPSQWEMASEGTVLAAGDSVRTGRGARAEIDLGGATARLFENSLLHLPPDGLRAAGAATVDLGRGDALFEVQKRAPADPFEVRTSEIVASVKGTRFAVQLGAMASVSVFSGLVGVRPPGADLANEMLVRPGFAAIGSARSNYELSPTPAIDPWQGWQQNATPPAAPEAPPGTAGHDAPTALQDAKDAALRASAPEVIGAVLDRRGDRSARDGANDGPRSRRSRRAHTRAAGAGADAGSGVDSVELAGNENVGAVPAVAVDPVSVAGRSGVGRSVREQIAETVLNGGLPSAAAAAAAHRTPMSLQLLTSPNRVLVMSPGGQLALLSRGDVVSVIASGDPGSLPIPLLTALSNNGVDPIAFAKHVRTMFP